VTGRHRRRTRCEYETIFGIEVPGDGREHLDLIFRRVVQARSRPLTDERYRELADQELLQEAVDRDSHSDAFRLLYETDDIGQKVANELLRHAVDLFEINAEWQPHLDVALDTNVVKTLVETGGIELADEERDRSAGGIVNMNPDADPGKLVAYQAVQDGFETAVGECESECELELHPIVFDELWLEHREFISDPLLQGRSILSEFLVER